MSPAICNAEYINGFIKRLESQFAFPFRWVDKCTFDGLDAYEKWLDDQKKSVEIMRFSRKTWLEEINSVVDGKDKWSED